MALMNCPECGKEVSDTAECCVHCGYKLKKEDPGKKKKMMIAGGAAVVVLLAACLIFFLVRSNGSIAGTWRIDHYILDGEKISADQIGEELGSDFQKRSGQFYVVFDKDGTAVISMPSYGDEGEKYEGRYTVHDNIVNIDVDGNSYDFFEIKGKTLVLSEYTKTEMGADMDIVFTKK